MTEAFDFSAAVIKPAKLPEESRTGRKSSGPSPMQAVLKESYETKTGRQMSVPPNAVKTVSYAIRRAADEMKIGARILYYDTKGKEIRAVKSETEKTEKGDPKLITAVEQAAKKRGNITIMFQGQKRKESKKDKPAAETPADENDENENDEDDENDAAEREEMQQDENANADENESVDA